MYYLNTVEVSKAVLDWFSLLSMGCYKVLCHDGHLSSVILGECQLGPEGHDSSLKLSVL